MPTKNRIGATVQLYPNQDADLIDKVLAIPKSQRNAELKRLLRRGLDLPDVQRIDQRARPDDSAQLAEIDTLRKAVAAVPTVIRQYADQLADQYAADMAEMQRQYQEQISALERRVNELAITGTVTPNDEMQITERMEKSAIDARKSKMKKAAW